jgi:DNA-directed RNA polymerase II subunit RPB2
LRRVSIQMNHETSKREPRRIHASSFGLMCPIDNPDGRPIGMVKSMSLFCRLSTQSPASAIREMLSKERHFVPIEMIHPSTWNPVWTRIFLNGEPVGVNQKDSETLHQNFLDARRTQKIDHFVSLYWNRLENEYYISTDAGRPCRPLYREGVTPEQIKRITSWKTMMEKQMDYIDAQEVECLKVSLVPFHPKQPSEIHGSTVFSASGGVLPITEFNPATRNTFSCQQSKQAVSIYNTAFAKRFDTISAILNSPQRPLAQTWTTQAVLGGNGCLPYGENAILALAVYTGYNQDDSVLMNSSSVARGMFHTTYFHSLSIEETMINPEIQSHTIIANPLTNPKYHAVALKKKQDQPDKDFSMLDGDGIVKVGSLVDDNTVIVGMVTPVTDVNGKIIDYRDSSSTPKRGHHGRVDAVYRFRTPVIKQMDGTTRGGLLGVKIRLAEHRLPILGDKFAARHGQKGTCGALLPEEDMPYTATGMRPDVVLNPHAFPSRMTIGQFVEMMSTKVGMTLGTLIDCNSYSTQNRMVEVKEILAQLGFNPYGHEVMYNGMTGEMMESDIFMGPAYYLRMKQMTEDKINYRTTGPRNNMTHQPVEGRANGGGLRIGEMERDSLLSHGISAFMQESMMKRSDGETFLFQPDTGRLDANIDIPTTQVEMPYSMRLFLQEMEAMHLQVKMASE